jgi:holo-[acyl-carrier protein] synthase
MHRVIDCGIDIIEIARVRAVFERFGARFLDRVYTEWERARAADRRDPGPFLAGRFAAKEAVLKVLGCGLFAGVPLAAIEIRAEDSGKPCCLLHGPAREKAAALGVARMLVSISHCDSHAIAQAIGVAD